MSFYHPKSLTREVLRPRDKAASTAADYSTCSLAICSLPEVSPDLFPVVADSRSPYCDVGWYKYNSDLFWDR